MVEMRTLTPYMQAKAVYDCWIFSLYILSGIEQGEITQSIFTKQLKLKTNGKADGIIKSVNQGETDIHRISDNLRVITMGTLFIALDKALDQVFGEKPNAWSDNDLDSLRPIVYMMRCAFAHTPASPIWCIRPQYRKAFKIKKIDFSIDFSQLNGKRMVYEHHSGSQPLFRLMEYCMDIIKEHSGV